MKNFIQTVVIISALGFSQALNAQTQIGGDIDGEAADDRSGESLSMPDAQTVAIGSFQNDGGGEDAGHVRIFEWTGSAWQQKGADIDGEAADDRSGVSASMPDASTIAIGAFGNSDNGTEAGHVRVFEWTGGVWQQKGANIDGEAAVDWSGIAVDMPDAQTVAIGAHRNDDGGTQSGHVRVYEWTGSAWQQKGSDIDGENSGDESGRAISMPDASTIAIGARYNAGNGRDAGHVRIYEWDGTDWKKKGADIDGEAAGDESGRSVSMPDALTVAIGAPANDGNGSSAGHVRIYQWDGSAWQQKGADIDGEALGDFSGISVSMPDAQTIAIGAGGNDGSGDLSGHTRIYRWTGSAWQQIGRDIDGAGASNISGDKVYMPDAQTVAISAPGNNDNGMSAGHVRVYSLAGLSSIELSTIENATVYPNPTNGQLSIDLDVAYPDVSITIRNVLGQEVLSQHYGIAEEVDLTIEAVPGIYYVEVLTGDKRKVFEVLKTK
ncbi:MAG: T9SS type A sorting domain-containing protein [Bacteroidota bacterium]